MGKKQHYSDHYPDLLFHRSDQHCPVKVTLLLDTKADNDHHSPDTRYNSVAAIRAEHERIKEKYLHKVDELSSKTTELDKNRQSLLTEKELLQRDLDHLRSELLNERKEKLDLAER